MSVKFNCTTVYGNPIEIQTPLIDELVAIVKGEKASDRRPLAVDILRYVTQKQVESEGQPELDRAARQALLNIHVDSLWNQSERHRLKAGRTSGIERLTLVTQ
jgi:hypothetical protein